MRDDIVGEVGDNPPAGGRRAVKQYDVRQCRVTEFTQLTADIYSAWVDAGELARTARPGQFAQIYVPGKTLRRPISICGVTRRQRHCALSSRSAGKGRPFFLKPVWEIPGIFLLRSDMALNSVIRRGRRALSAAVSACLRFLRPRSPSERTLWL